jgi:hypothetical protein
MKSGLKTTEFWSKLIASLVGLAVGTGSLNPDTGQIINDAAGQALPIVKVIVDGVIQLTGILTAFFLQLGYGKQRSNIKMLDIKRQALVMKK